MIVHDPRDWFNWAVDDDPEDEVIMSKRSDADYVKKYMEGVEKDTEWFKRVGPKDPDLRKKLEKVQQGAKEVSEHIGEKIETR